MRRSFVLCLLFATISVPALAADADQNLKQEVEKIGAAYAENFNKQNGAGDCGALRDWRHNDERSRAAYKHRADL